MPEDHNTTTAQVHATPAMLNTAERPSYVPAPLLISSSPFSASQLIALFDDFHSSLRYISTAPELVFERLLGNLNETLNKTLEEEREHHSSDLTLCQSSNAKLKQEVDELRHVNQELIEAAKERAYISCLRSPAPETVTTPSPTVAITKKRPNPYIGGFHTNEVRYWFNVRAKTSKQITFRRPYTAPPSLPIGLTTIDIGEFADAHFKAYSNNINTDGFEIHIDSWENSVLFGAASAWLEIEENDPGFQHGTYSTPSNHASTPCKLKNSLQVTFPRKYDAPPAVVVWLTGFEMSRERAWRIKAYATDITETGFTIHIDTWEDSILYSGLATWVAYPVDRPGVYSGSFSTLNSPNGSNDGYEAFGDSVFDAPPRVLSAISALDMGCGRAMRLTVKTSSISAGGMSWSLEGWMCSVVNGAEAAYIALT